MSKREINISVYAKNKESGYIHIQMFMYIPYQAMKRMHKWQKIFINITKKTLRSETPAFEYILTGYHKYLIANVCVLILGHFWVFFR